MPDTDPDRPNVLFVLSDQHRADALGAAGHPTVRTPNLDALADRGVRFSAAHTTCPVCVPARASMYTGVYPHNTGVLGNDAYLPLDYRTWFEALREAGYYTAHVGEAHQRATDHLRDNEEYMRDLGFEYVHETAGPWGTRSRESYMTDEWREKGLYDVYCEDLQERLDAVDARQAREAVDKCTWASPLPVEDHMDSYVGRQAVEFVRGYDRDEPFCAYVGFSGPHGPMDPPGEYAELYDPADVPDPIPPTEPGEWVPPAAADYLADQGWAPAYYTDEMAREYRAAYYGLVTLVDHWIGEIRDALAARGMLENTLIVYAADHGEFAGDHARFGKNCFLDASVRIPMVVSWPGVVDSGATCDAPVELIDVGATAVDAAGAVDREGAGTLDGRTTFGYGRSLLDAASAPDDPDAAPREAAFGVIRRNAMIRTREYKYAIRRDGEGYLLFDVADPTERENLIGHPEYAGVERGLRDRLLGFLQRTGTGFRRQDGTYVVADGG